MISEVSWPRTCSVFVVMDFLVPVVAITASHAATECASRSCELVASSYRAALAR